jgi:hypothetical protein
MDMLRAKWESWVIEAPGRFAAANALNHPGDEIDVHVLMEHIHQRLLDANAPSSESGIPANPLWTNLETDWGRILGRLQCADRDGKIYALLTSHLPAYPWLSSFAHLLGLRRFRFLLLFPCQLALRALRPLILMAGRRQERVNQSLVGSGRGLAYRLADYERHLLEQRQRLATFEEQIHERLEAQAARIRVLEALVGPARRAA